MQKTSQDHPSWMTIFANRLRRLEQMFNLREVGIRIALVNQRVEILGHLPDRLFAALQAAIFHLLLQHKVQRLVGVILAVELGDRGIGISVVVAELFFRLAGLIPALDKIIPILELLQGSILVCGFHTDKYYARLYIALQPRCSVSARSYSVD